MNSGTGKIIIITGILIVLVGVLIYFFHGKLNWIGNLPGDIKIERPNFKMYIPITTMILLSVLITLLMRIWTWLK
jgi:hypothetical protein